MAARTLADQVQEFMDAEGLNPTDMARRIGGDVERQHVSRLLATGDSVPRYILRLAEVMSTTADDLLRGRYVHPSKRAKPLTEQPTLQPPAGAVHGDNKPATQGSSEVGSHWIFEDFITEDEWASLTAMQRGAIVGKARDEYERILRRRSAEMPDTGPSRKPRAAGA